MSVSQGTLYGLLTMMGFGMCNALSRIPVSEIGPLKTLFYRGVCITLMQLFFLVLWFPIQIDLVGLLMGIAVAVFAYFPVMFFYKGLNLGRVGVIVPIANTSAIITTLLAVIFLNETFSTLQIGSAFVIIVGVFLLSVDFKSFRDSGLLRFTSGVPYALGACVLWGILFFVYKYPVSHIGPILTSFFVEVGVMVLCFGHIKIKKESLSIPIRYFQYLIPNAFFSIIASVSYNIGIESSAMSVVAMLYMANPLISTLYVRIFYQEKLSIQQYIGISVAIIGLVCFSA